MNVFDPQTSSFHFDIFQFFSDLLDKVARSTNLDDKLEGIEKFRVWKYRIGLILRENDPKKYIKDEVAELEEYEANEKH